MKKIIILLSIFILLIASATALTLSQREALDQDFAEEKSSFNCEDIANPIVFTKVSNEWVCNTARGCYMEYTFSSPRLNKLSFFENRSISPVQRYYTKAEVLPRFSQIRQELQEKLTPSLIQLCYMEIDSIIANQEKYNYVEDLRN